MATYEAAVAEFRSLDESIEAGRWRQAQITWEVTHSGISQGQWIRDTGANRKHIQTLIYVWDRHGRPGNPSVTFAEAYRMAETFTDTPEEASAAKDTNRAASALGKLPPEQKTSAIAAAAEDLEPEQQAEIVERMLQGDQGHKTRAKIAPVIQRHDQRTETTLGQQRQRQIDDGQRPDFEATEAVQRVIASGHQYLTDVAHLPSDLTPRSRELLTHLATRMLPVVEWQAALETEPSVSDAAEEILRGLS